MGDVVTLREVGPRDGLQTSPVTLGVSPKVELVNRLALTGVTRLEAGSFVRPDVVPAMADSDIVFARISRRPGLSYEALVPNARGAERAIEARAPAVMFVLTASETFNRLNSRMSVAASVDEFERVLEVLAGTGVSASGTIGTAFGCPYEGPVDQAKILRLVETMAGLGARDVILADTTGLAHPQQVGTLLAAAKEVAPLGPQIGFHAHDTRGLGLMNAAAAVDVGITLLDSSVGGLGGCPFAPDGAGNVCTEDLVHMLSGLGFSCGVDLNSVIDTAQWLEGQLGYRLPGKVMRAGPSDRRYDIALAGTRLN